MVARLICGAIQGVDAFRVDLEVDLLRKGLPAFVMVGLAEGAVREAKERVFAALRSSGFRLPPARVTVNLAPADRRKGGSGYDLPLAVGLLTAAGLLPEERVQGWFLVGELSLSGEIRPVPGVLPLALLARAEGAAGLVVAPENASEAALAGIPAYGAASLTQAAGFLAGEVSLERAEAPAFSPDGPAGPDDAGALPDFADVKGQEHAKRAVEIAAAGTICFSSARPEAARPCLRNAFPRYFRLFRLPKLWKPPRSTVWPAFWGTAGFCADGPSAPRTTRFRMWRWWEADRRRGRARCPWRTGAFFFWTNCRNTARRRWRLCASRWKTARSPYLAR